MCNEICGGVLPQPSTSILRTGSETDPHGALSDLKCSKDCSKLL